MFVSGSEAKFIFGQGSQIFPNLPVAMYGTTAVRIVSDAGEKWFEFGFRLDHALTGNGATGWTDADNYLRIETQYSLDLVNWSMGKFLPAPVPVVDLGDGTYEYWSRALNPVDTAVKTGSLVISQTGGDVRKHPLTSIVIAGTVLSLPHYPYDMAVAGTAAQLEADLISAGFPGSLVAGSSRATWSISIPSVNYTSYAQNSSVGWPIFLAGTDLFGNPAYSSGVGFSGTFVDAASTPIMPKAFARLKISGGSRYDPYA